MRLPKLVQHRLRYVDISPRIARADVVHRTWPPPFEGCQNGPAVIIDIDPVANIQAVAINRNRFIVHCVRDHERQEFFGELSRTIVVTAPRYDRVQTESVVRRSHQMFRSSLGSRVGTVWPERRIFSEESFVIFGQTAHHFIGRDLQEASDAAFPRAIQQHLSSQSVRVNEFAGRDNASVDVRFSRKVDYRLRAIAQYAQHTLAVCNIAVDEKMALFIETLEIVEVSCIRQGIEVCDLTGG